jgi:hypothetical protein
MRRFFGRIRFFFLRLYEEKIKKVIEKVWQA